MKSQQILNPRSFDCFHITKNVHIGLISPLFDSKKINPNRPRVFYRPYFFSALCQQTLSMVNSIVTFKLWHS